MFLLTTTIWCDIGWLYNRPKFCDNFECIIIMFMYFVMVCSLMSYLKRSRFAEPVCFYNFKESSSQLDVNLEAYLKLLTCVAGLFPNAYNLQWVLYESTDTSTSQIRTNQMLYLWSRHFISLNSQLFISSRNWSSPFLRVWISAYMV